MLIAPTVLTNVENMRQNTAVTDSIQECQEINIIILLKSFAGRMVFKQKGDKVNIKPAGKDKWGYWYSFTGNESNETCFWCGKPTGQRYCKGQKVITCRTEYVKRFHWLEASRECIRKARVGGRDWYNPVVKCHDCGVVGYVTKQTTFSGRQGWFYTYRGKSQPGTLQQLMEFEGITYVDGFEIHHVIPLDGEDRNWHWLNQWLVCLCKDCHRDRHRELNYLLSKNTALELLPEPQLCLPL